MLVMLKFCDIFASDKGFRIWKFRNIAILKTKRHYNSSEKTYITFFFLNNRRCK